MTTVPRLTVWLAVALLAVAGSLTGRGAIGSEAGSGSSAPAQRSPVVVELFTSQGCSSCPPADRFLTELAAREDGGVIALSFHVDYWNYIGWTDPFSSSSWSDRQRHYARALGGERIYTPQMVINGRWEEVGSSRRDVVRLLERAWVESPGATIEVSARLVSRDRIRVDVTSEWISPGVETRRLAVRVAVVESGLETHVGRGENAAKVLHNNGVVRVMRDLAEPRLDRAGAVGSLEVALEDDWRRDQLSVAAFFQETDSLRIRAAARAELIP